MILLSSFQAESKLVCRPSQQISQRQRETFYSKQKAPQFKSISLGTISVELVKSSVEFTSSNVLLSNVSFRVITSFSEEF